MTTPPDAYAWLRKKARAPLAVILGSPAEVTRHMTNLKIDDAICFQMDLYQADRLREDLDRSQVHANVATSADLWDLPNDHFESLFYPAAEGGERGLKLDMIEQAYHILRDHGTLVVWSPYSKDEFFPGALKKVFGRVHAPPTDVGQIFWCQRQGPRPRRRHEITFQARFDDNRSLRFLSRPGVFAYGLFDNGARALVETMRIEPGDRIIDLGCGCGTNGVWAGLLSGPAGSVTFIDSNVRALALAEHNARANGLASFRCIASCNGLEVPQGNCDVVLANPPYYAQLSIAAHFVGNGRRFLRPGGCLYLVTKKPNQVGPVVADTFGPTQAVTRRGYVVLCARVPEGG